MGVLTKAASGLRIRNAQTHSNRSAFELLAGPGTRLAILSLDGRRQQSPGRVRGWGVGVGGWDVQTYHPFDRPRARFREGVTVLVEFKKFGTGCFTKCDTGRSSQVSLVSLSVSLVVSTCSDGNANTYLAILATPPAQNGQTFGPLDPVPHPKSGRRTVDRS